MTEYAKMCQQQGFKGALLMSVQPDQDISGPRDRHSTGGFDIGFEDLSAGHLNHINARYFDYLDKLISILLSHGIVPVYQPVFHGYGWKGKRVLGKEAVPDEYACYCRYLVARYGAWPAMWLVSGDGTGLNDNVKPAGVEIEKWDCYKQPTGIHYNPFDDYQPKNLPDIPKELCFHGNKSHQAESWLDFQWAQTGHDGIHKPKKVTRMYDNIPIKAVGNGEPTYECMGNPYNATGWWQGHEAWNNLMAGGTMGVVYGAAGLWQWKFTRDEPGWEGWTDAEVSWKDALTFDGAKYVGYISRALAGLEIFYLIKTNLQSITFLKQ